MTNHCAKTDADVDAVTRRVLGISAYLDQVSPAGERARRRWDELASGPFYPVDQRRDELERLRRLDEQLDEASIDRFQDELAGVPTLERTHRRLAAGETLRDADFFEIKRFLYYAVSLLEAADGLDGLPGPDAEVTDVFRGAMGTIHPGHAWSTRFHLADELDPKLERGRAKLRTIRRRTKERRKELEARVVDDRGGSFDIHGRFRPPEEADEIDDDRLSLVDGWYRLDDDELRKLDDHRQQLLDRVLSLEHDQRRRLTSFVEDIADHLADINEKLTDFDLRLARIELRRAVDGCWPGDADEDRCWLSVTGGRDPVLVEAMGRDAVQPVDVGLDAAGTVVLGPNMGGKTALLRLVGIVQWCAAMALPVPAEECRVDQRERIVYLGGEQPDQPSTDRGLSSFGREVRRFVEFWETGDSTLWLLDEPCRGTHPEEGRRLAAEIAAERIERGDVVVMATHFPGLAEETGFTRLRIAGLEADDQGLDELLDTSTMDEESLQQALGQLMDYRVVEDPDGRVPRDGRAIARALGLELD